MKTVHNGNASIASILEIIHTKCKLIGRPSLVDVKAEDIKLLMKTATGGQIVYLRGMRYQVNLIKETFGIFDPVPTSSSARKRTSAYRGHLAYEW